MHAHAHAYLRLGLHATLVAARDCKFDVLADGMYMHGGTNKCPPIQLLILYEWLLLIWALNPAFCVTYVVLEEVGVLFWVVKGS